MDHGLFDTFAPLIAALADRTPLLRSDLLVPEFRLDCQGPLEMYYVPFELINTQARVMLVGITPGWTQMERVRGRARRAATRRAATRRADW